MPARVETEEGRDSGSVFGFGVSLVLLGLALFVALAESALELAAFAAATLTLMLGLRLWGRLALDRLEVRLPRDVRRCFTGEIVELAIDVENRKALPVLAKIEIRCPAGLSFCRDEGGKPKVGEGIARDRTIACGEVGLGSFGRERLSLSFRATRRGVYPLGPIILSGCDGLGLYRREREFEPPGEIVAFPKIRPIRELELPFRDYFGIHPSKGIIEDPAYYEGTREYTGLRPAKAIHWKASARLGLLQEKIFQPTSQLKVVFLVDGELFSDEGAEASFESAMEMAASLLSSFSEKGASFAIATDRRVPLFPASIPFGRGPEQLGSCLELLARCERGPGWPLLPLPSGIASTAASFIIVARSPGEATASYFKLPATRRDRILFIFEDRAEQAARDGYPAISFREALGALA
jgi:Uncharacterized conserved protein (some members contain a von Willebrand factor type A (vWA) domain)